MHTWGVWYVEVVGVPDRCSAWNICSKSTPPSTFLFMKLKVSILSEMIYTYCGPRDMITKILLVDMSEISGLAIQKHKWAARSWTVCYRGQSKAEECNLSLLETCLRRFLLSLDSHNPYFSHICLFSGQLHAAKPGAVLSVCLFNEMLFFFLLLFRVHKNVQPLTVSIQNSTGKFWERKFVPCSAGSVWHLGA